MRPPDVVHLEDCPLVQTLAAKAAEINNLNYKAFNNLEDFKAAMENPENHPLFG